MDCCCAGRLAEGNVVRRARRYYGRKSMETGDLEGVESYAGYLFTQSRTLENRHHLTSFDIFQGWNKGNERNRGKRKQNIQLPPQIKIGIPFASFGSISRLFSEKSASCAVAAARGIVAASAAETEEEGIIKEIVSEARVAVLYAPRPCVSPLYLIIYVSICLQFYRIRRRGWMFGMWMG